MNELSNPQLYPWTKNEIAEKLENSLQDELKLENNDMYKALIEATARMAEISTERTNEVPDKAYRTFLDFAGSDYLPAAPATTPVQFTVSNSIGELQKETIAKGFQISGSEEEGEEQIFETVEDITVQKSNLAAIKFVDYYRNLSTDHSKLIEVDPEVAEAQRLLKGKEPFTYKIHLEHPRFSELGPESAQDLRLKINFDGNVQNTWTSEICELFDFEVTYQGEEKKETIKFDPSKNEITSDPSFIILNLPIQRPVPVEIDKQALGDPIIYEPTFASIIQETELTCSDKSCTKGYFLTLEIKPKLSQLLTTPKKVEDNVTLEEAIRDEYLVPTVESIEYCFNDIREGTNISRAFFNSQELDLSAGFMPFGEQPQVNDCFYFAAPEIFEYGYKDVPTKITTQIMGDINDPKYEDEDDPKLLPYNAYVPQGLYSFSFKRVPTYNTHGLSIEKGSYLNSFHLILRKSNANVRFEDIIINENGEFTKDSKPFSCDDLCFFNITPNSVPQPVDYFHTDMEEINSVAISHYSCNETSFKLVPQEEAKLNYIITDVSTTDFTLKISVDFPEPYGDSIPDRRTHTFRLFIDHNGQVRHQDSGIVLEGYKTFTIEDVNPNSVPKECSGSSDKEIEIVSITKQLPPAFELINSTKIEHYTETDLLWEIEVTSANEHSFNLRMRPYFEVGNNDVAYSSTINYNGRKFYTDVAVKTYNVYISPNGEIRNADHSLFAPYCCSNKVTGSNGIFKAIPVEDTYYFLFADNMEQKLLRIPQKRYNLETYNKLTLLYEYFDGNDWKSFNTDERNNYLTFQRSGIFNIKLEALDEVTPSTINGIKDWWIRARIIKGGYGNPAGFQNVKLHPGWLYVSGNTGNQYIEPYEKEKNPKSQIEVIEEVDGEEMAIICPLIGPAAPLVEEVPESFKAPIIREMKVHQGYEPFTKFGSEAYWYPIAPPAARDSVQNAEFVVRKDGSVYHELPSGITNFEAAKFDKKAKDLYENNISYYIPDTEDPTRVDLPGKFPIVEVPNDDTGSFPAVYFGFKGDKLEGTYNSLFLSLEETPFYYRKDVVLTEEAETSSPTRGVMVVSEDGIPQYTKSDDIVSRIKASLSWQYFGNNGWQELPVEDKTFGFTKSNNIGFTFPVDAQKSTVLSETNYWIRAVVIDPELTPLNSVALKGAYQNTVLATNLTTVRNERLGSSNGKENQTFKLRFAPVVGDLRLFVGEVDMISDKELRELFTDKYGIPFEQATDELYSQFVAQAVSIAKDDNDSVLGVSVEWNRVANFVNSKPDSRHYMFDHVTGDILFGDGVNGMIPDIGRENIIAHHYQYGGGTGGNVPHKTIDKMRNRAQIVSKVTNVANGSGGGDRENISDLLKRGSCDLKAHDRAVTAEDYEILAKKSTTNVAKAVAKSSHHPDGSVGTSNVTVSILTHDLGEKPMPSAKILDDVKQYIAERSPMQIQDTKNELRETRDRLPEELKKASFYSQYNAKVEVIPPNYVPVGVSAKLHFTNPDEAQDVTSSIEAELATFLHPLHGNYGRGWNFGESFTSGIIEQFIRRQNGVKSVTDVAVDVSQLLLKLKLSLPEEWDTNLPSYTNIKAGQFIDLYDADSLDPVHAPDNVRFQAANNVTLSKEANIVKVIGFTEGDTLELLSTTPIYKTESDDTYGVTDKSDNSIVDTILSTGRISGFSKSYTFPRCKCKEVPQMAEESTEPCKCGCLPNIPEISTQQPVYYIDVDLMHLDSISKAVLPAIYEYDGDEEIKIQGKTILYEKLKQITNLEVRTIRGYSEEPKRKETGIFHRKTHALKAVVSEIITADEKVIKRELKNGFYAFHDLTGEIEIAKIGIMFPSFVNTNTVLHPMFQGAEDPIKLKTYSVDPEIKTVHLTDWDLPCAGEFSISDASTKNQTENEE